MKKILSAFAFCVAYAAFLSFEFIKKLWNYGNTV